MYSPPNSYVYIHWILDSKYLYIIIIIINICDYNNISLNVSLNVYELGLQSIFNNIFFHFLFAILCTFVSATFVIPGSYSFP